MEKTFAIVAAIDYKKTWHDAQMKAPLSKWAWSLWRHDWGPSSEAEYIITVRAFDGDGMVQESGLLLGNLLRSFPDGAKRALILDLQLATS